ncbi:unnamed protein product [Calicophoron daubneyi]|uniref:Uncharacterized protein n=1 Tax=Calicophoron daubneyi TaxID=300641 RepID=A0AAV2SZM3_CALDB
MDSLYARLNQVRCCTTDGLLRHGAQDEWHQNRLAILATPGLSRRLSRISGSLGVLEAANQFADPVEPHSDYRPQTAFDQRILAEKGQTLLDQFHRHLNLQDVSRLPDQEVNLELNEAEEVLDEYERELTPLVRKAQERIQWTNDRLNVTDRLLGYHNNITRVGPAKFAKPWSIEIPNHHTVLIAPRFNVSDQCKKSCEVSQPGVRPNKRGTGWPSTPQERAGLEVRYPGISETRARFTAPPKLVTEVLNNHGEVRECTPGYRINPTPEYRVYGWDSTKVQKPDPADVTEFTHSYVWPDRKLVHTNPWNRSLGRRR